MREAGYMALLVTNQSGVARGYFDMEQLGRVHSRVEELLAAEGARLDGIFVCPHLPDDNCSCRKPSPGLIAKAVERFGVAPHKSYVIGDKPCDIELGTQVGATTILVRTGYGAQYEGDPLCRPDFVCDNLLDAAQHMAQAAKPAAKDS